MDAGRGWADPDRGAVAWSASAWLQGRLADARARYLTGVLGAFAVAAGIAVALSGAVPHVPGAVVVGGWAVVGAGMGLVYSSTSVLVLQLSPPERHGEASSALTTGEALASSVVLAVAGGAFAALLPAGVTGTQPAGALPYLAGIGTSLVIAVVGIAAAWRVPLVGVAAPACIARVS